MTRMRRDFREQARREGIGRPMELLLRMGNARRRQLALHLGLYDATANMEADEEAWTLLVRNLKGIRARTHYFIERIVPFIPCVTWDGILHRTARFYGLRVDGKRRDLERRIFEHFSLETTACLDIEELTFLDAAAHAEPSLVNLFDGERLSVPARRMAAGSIYRFAAHELVALWERAAAFDASRRRAPLARKVAVWIQHGLAWTGRRLRHFPRLRSQAVRPIEFFDHLLRTHPGRVVPFIMAVYLYDLLGGRTLLPATAEMHGFPGGSLPPAWG